MAIPDSHQYRIFEKLKTLINNSFLIPQSLKGTVVNQALSFLQVGLLEIMLTFSFAKLVTIIHLFFLNFKRKFFNFNNYFD